MFAHLLVQMPHESIPSTATLLYFQFTSTPQYNVYIRSSGYQLTAVQRVKKFFLKMFVLRDVEYFHCTFDQDSSLSLCYAMFTGNIIDYSATRLYSFTSRHGVVCQYIQIFYLTHVLTDKYQFTNRSVLCAWNRLATGTVGKRRVAFS